MRGHLMGAVGAMGAVLVAGALAISINVGILRAEGPPSGPGHLGASNAAPVAAELERPTRSAPRAGRSPSVAPSATVPRPSTAPITGEDVQPDD